MSQGDYFEEVSDAIHVARAGIRVLFVEKNHLLLMAPQIVQRTFVDRSRRGAQSLAEYAMDESDELLVTRSLVEVVEVVEVEQHDFLWMLMEKRVDLFETVTHQTAEQTVREGERRACV